MFEIIDALELKIKEMSQEMDVLNADKFGKDDTILNITNVIANVTKELANNTVQISSNAENITKTLEELGQIGKSIF